MILTCLQYKSFENTVGKGEIACNEQFLLFLPCFLPDWRTLWHFHWIWNCCLQTLSVWKSLKFVVWERFISLQNKKVLALTTGKALADNKFNFTKMTISVSEGYKALWRKEKMLKSSILLFSKLFSTFSSTNIFFSPTFKLLSTNTFNLDLSKILLSVRI